MKAISLLQPWAHLVVHGHKQFETRSFKRNHRGPILIHASKSKSQANQLIHTWPFNEYIFSINDLSFGAIIGVVTIDQIITSEQWISDHNHRETERAQEEFRFGDYSPNRFAWKLSNPIPFPQPIPINGNLGLWEYKNGFHKENNSIMINYLFGPQNDRKYEKYNV